MKTPTVFSDPGIGLELARRIHSRPRAGWLRRLFTRKPRVTRARFGNETIISERLR